MQKSEIFARVRASELMSRVGGAQIRIQRQKLCRFASRMVDFVVIRDSVIFARVSQIWPGLVSYFHEFLALRALSEEM